MSHFSYSELLSASGGEILTPEKSFESARLWTDTRSLQAGDFFLPVAGERFDGHDYLVQAYEAGAVGAFVQRNKAAAHPEWQQLPNLIAVEDTVLAYLAMARFHRDKIDPLVIAVTGSSGKTTTKEMLAAAFAPLKSTAKTQKNFNNEIGVAQTLLGLQPGTEVLIVEMGMRGPRQICILSEAARPDAALIVSIGPAHIEFLGSLENIAKAKLEIAEGLDPGRGVLVYNADSPHLPELAPQVWSGRQIGYHLGEAQNIQPYRHEAGEGVQFTYKNIQVTLAAPGEHLVANALGVLKLGEALGFSVVDLAPGLAAFTPERGRGDRVPLSGYQNVWVINDAYNANPDSARAALKAFLSTARPGFKHILVLGGMKELGDFSRSYHEELGRWLAAQPNIDALYVVGEEAPWLAEGARQAPYPVCAMEDVAEVAAALKRQALENAVLYLKGSRAYRLDEIAEVLARQHERMHVGEAN